MRCFNTIGIGTLDMRCMVDIGTDLPSGKSKLTQIKESK
jgi:hypothetical protein